MWRASTSLPVPDSPVIRIDASDAATCSAHGGEHGRVAGDHGVGLPRRSLQYGGDQVGVGRQRQEFPRPITDGAHGLRGIRVRATGDDGDHDALMGQRPHECPDVMRQFDQQQVHLSVRAQMRERAAVVVRLVQLGAACRGDTGGLAQLTP